MNSEPAAPEELGRLQRWLQAVITHPDGVGAGITSSAASKFLVVAHNDVERIILPSSQMSSLERLQIYAILAASQKGAQPSFWQ